MMRTLVIVAVVFVIGLVVGAGVAPLLTGAPQGTSTQTVTQDVTKLVTSTAVYTLTEHQNTITRTTIITPEQPTTIQTPTTQAQLPANQTATVTTSTSRAG